MNKIILVGNIATDIESRTTQSGIHSCTFRVATRRNFRNASGGYDSDFHSVICWRQNADFATNYLAKGNRVCIEGSVQYRNYEKDGVKHYVTEVIVERIENLTPRGASNAENVAIASESEGGFTEVNDGELPF